MCVCVYVYVERTVCDNDNVFMTIYNMHVYLALHTL